MNKTQLQPQFAQTCQTIIKLATWGVISSSAIAGVARGDDISLEPGSASASVDLAPVAGPKDLPLEITPTPATVPSDKPAKVVGADRTIDLSGVQVVDAQAKADSKTGAVAPSGSNNGANTNNPGAAPGANNPGAANGAGGANAGGGTNAGGSAPNGSGTNGAGNGGSVPAANAPTGTNNAVGSAPSDAGNTPAAPIGGNAAGSANGPTTAPSTTSVAASELPSTPSNSIILKGLNASGAATLMVNKAALITTRVPFRRVSIGQPEIADVNPVGPSEMLLMAKRPGSTQLIVWDDRDHSQVVDVIVSFDLRGVDAQIKDMFPRGIVSVESANGALVLRGHVPDLQTAQRIAEVAQPYAGNDRMASPVLNFLEISGGQQVMLQVRFAEVSRSVTRNLGFNAFATDGKFSLGMGLGPTGSAPTVANAATIGTSNGGGVIPIYGGAQFGSASLEYFVNALRSNSLLRILAEPNLTATSGQAASFLAGGEFPVPVPQAGSGGTAITIAYKQYGIQLNFTPTVLGDGRIRLACTPAVSELDYTNSVTLQGFTIPGLTTRNVNTTVELAEGQTFALAGLLQNQVKANKAITPLIGDMPVLGALFRSVNYQRSETELVVLVTPRLVEPLNPGQVPTLPGEHWRDPSEAQLYLNGDLGGPATDTRHAPVKSSRFYGSTGFNPVTSEK